MVVACTLPDVASGGYSGHLAGDTSPAFTQKTFAPLLGGLPCPIAHRAAKVAGVAVPQHLCNLRNVQILLRQKLDRPLLLRTFEYLGKGCPLLHQQTLKRPGAQLHRFGNIRQRGSVRPARIPDSTFHSLRFDENLAQRQCDFLEGLFAFVGV